MINSAAQIRFRSTGKRLQRFVDFLASCRPAGFLKLKHRFSSFYGRFKPFRAARDNLALHQLPADAVCRKEVVDGPAEMQALSPLRLKMQPMTQHPAISRQLEKCTVEVSSLNQLANIYLSVGNSEELKLLSAHWAASTLGVDVIDARAGGLAGKTDQEKPLGMASPRR
jgi:hypothetical protein